MERQTASAASSLTPDIILRVEVGFRIGVDQMDNQQEHEQAQAPETDPGTAIEIRQTANAPRRLHRSDDQRMLLGVCGGLSEYFDIDATIIRIVFALAALFGGGGVLVYVVLALIMPSAESLDSHPRDAARSTVDEAVEETSRLIRNAGEWVRAKSPW